MGLAEHGFPGLVDISYNFVLDLYLVVFSKLIFILKNLPPFSGSKQSWILLGLKTNQVLLLSYVSIPYTAWGGLFLYILIFQYSEQDRREYSAFVSRLWCILSLTITSERSKCFVSWLGLLILRDKESVNPKRPSKPLFSVTRVKKDDRKRFCVTSSMYSV